MDAKHSEDFAVDVRAWEPFEVNADLIVESPPDADHPETRSYSRFVTFEGAVEPCPQPSVHAPE